MPQAPSVRSITRSTASGVKKLGQPQWESNLASLRNSSAPHARQWYTPVRWLSVYSPVFARSVPALRSTSYSWGVSCARHSSSDFTTFGAGISSVRRMPSTVPTGRGTRPYRPVTSPDPDDPDDAVDDGQQQPEQDQADHDLRGRAAGAGQPGQALAERGQV